MFNEWITFYMGVPMGLFSGYSVCYLFSFSISRFLSSF